MGSAPRRATLALGLGLARRLLAAATRPVAAGPPFQTDDPEPVEYRHWEVYAASQWSRDASGWSGTCPHLEVNYGAVPEVQLHLIAPLAVSAPAGGVWRMGYGDTELGVKVRGLRETGTLPQVGTFPILDLPTGDGGTGLGSGHARLLVPVWLQKGIGKWLTYGGGGCRWALGEPGRGSWFAGWELQRQLLPAVAAGGELFHATPGQDQPSAETGFDLGAIVDLSGLHHLLLSAGRDLQGPARFTGYAAWQLTFGPAAR